MKKLDILIAVLVAFAWGSNFIAVKYSLIELPPILSTAIRFLFAGLFLLPFTTRPKIPFLELYILSVIMGVLYLGMLYYAMHLGINAGLASIMMQLNAPLSLIIARLYLKEYFSLKTIIGIILAFIGVILVVGTPDATGSYSSILVIIISAFFCAVFNNLNRKFKSFPPLTMVCWTSIIASPHLFLISFFLEGNTINQMLNSTLISWSAILYSIIIASYLGIGLWVHLLQKYPVAKVLPFNLLVPFFGVSLSIFILGDIPSWHVFIGGMLTITGVAIANIPFPTKNFKLNQE